MTPLATMKALYSFVRLAHDPTRLDQVFELRKSASAEERRAAAAREMKKLPGGVALFQEKPRIGRIDLAHLRTLPEGTLGRTYADFMTARGLMAEALPTYAVQSDGDYFSAHLYETHDLWHVLTGFNTDPAGEAGLQAFYAAQIPSPLPAVLTSALFLNAAWKGNGQSAGERFDAVSRGWQLGRRAKCLFGIRWNEHWNESINALRARYGIEIN